MKKFYEILFILSIIVAIFIFWYYKSNITLAKDIHSIQQKIIPSPVIATISKDCNVYLDKELKNVITTIKKDTNVEILQDKTKKIYCVKNEQLNIQGWVKREDLYIPETPLASKEYLKDIELEAYVNYLGLDSKTEYLIFTDIYRQLTYIFKGKCENWKIIKTIPCATGLNESPTTRGIFKISDKGNWFYSERLGSGAMYWLRFNGSYLYHSVAMDKNKNIIDNTIGQRCSSGCVRMSIDDIKWVYDNIEQGTTVYIN
ncbi:L,D-transpeptidase [uncultured Tyzzerella sp.]|uniref:L,D-transpeptidase n=1 Tax=uncultured Tyzzerella sp. TaxID=2321398 RepID=UPI00294245B6|nr:L,D-transpeptidase [uncultured Tyzzerella sp.]